MSKVRKISKKITGILLSLALLISNFIPAMVVYADPVNSSYTITFQLANTNQNEHTIQMNQDGIHLEIDGGIIELRDGNNSSFGTASCNLNGTCQITVENGPVGTLNYGGGNFDLFNTQGHVKYNYTTINTNTVFLVEDKTNEQPNPPQQGPVGGTEDVYFDITFSDAHIIAQINNKNIVDDANGNLTYTFKDTVTEAGNATGTNTIRLQTPFGDYPLKEVTINGTKYTGTEANVVIDDIDSAWTITVATATSYTITAKADTSIVLPRTIIWVNPDYVPKDEEDARWVSDFTIGHGYAKAIEVYDENGTKLNPDQYINNGVQPDGSSSDIYGINNGFGWITIKPGYRTVFEFVPEYGYQLTGITINENPLGAVAATNRFEITLPNDPEGSGNIHFGATFTKTSDVVKASAKSVESGEIALGNTLSGGSAQLTVSDAKLSAAKEAEFEKAAGDYEITDYLDIDLYQVFYKGKNDSNDVWKNEIEELSNYATISMKLEDGMDADSIVLVHNIHDGKEFEIINVDSYDEETNTITFKTKSFSNYAIATKSYDFDIEAKDNTSEDNAAKDEVATLIQQIIRGKNVEGVSTDLKEALIKAVEDGKTITVDLTTAVMDEKNIKEDAEKIEKLVDKNGNIARYYNIAIRVSVDGQYVGNITELAGKMAITLDIPSDIATLKEGYTRTFTVVRVHNGKAEKLATTQNSDDTLTFETDGFSTYAITYTDTIKTSSPNTSDNIMLFITLLILSGLGLTATVIYKRKLNN